MEHVEHRRPLPGSRRRLYTRLNPDKAKNRALDQLRKMGYDVTLKPHTAAA